ncbi:MAG: hypothetical protein KatS3mg035_0368 [Bacteroidia bacterium]|nr:MAG: hypothetical protein KatS3mg035_0368 [Bacteroidia bacterium]
MAIPEISTFTLRGKVFTATASLAGYTSTPSKYSPYILLTVS